MRRSIALFPLPALLLAVTSAPLLAQNPGAACPAPAQDTGFQEIAVNVNAGTFSQVLPFDVPIRLCGSTAANTKVEVVYAASCGPPVVGSYSCRELADRDDLPTGPVELTREQCKSGQPVFGRAGDSTLDGTTFRTVVPRLEADRFYAFCFLQETPVSADQAAAFAARARPILDRALSAIPTGDFTAEQSTDLRKQLTNALLQEVDSESEVLASGTLFDPTVPSDQVRGNFNAHLRGVLEPQLRRQAQIGNFASQQLQLRSALDQVRSDGSLDRLVAQLEQSALGNVNLATLLSNEYQDELALSRLTDDEAAAAALGQGATGTADLATTTDAAEAGQIAANYQKLSQSLSNPDPRSLGLDELIQDALGSGLLSQFVGGLSAEDRASLQKLANGPVRQAAFAAFALAGQAQTIQRTLGDRADALQRLVDTVEVAAATVSVANASSTGNFKTASNNYISADGGLLFAPAIDEVVPYVGTNIYFRPVNKDAPLKSLGSFGKTFGRRFALSIGLTVSSVSLKEEQDTLTVRDDLFGTQNLVLGAGLRLTDMIRFTAGALVFKEDDPSPLVDDLEVTATYYVSLSFDLDVASAFKGGFGSLFN